MDNSFATPLKGVEKMLELGIVKLVFCKTHTSFIFSINIPPTTSPVPFYVLNQKRDKIDAPVYSIVLKFAVMMPVCRLPRFKCRMCRGECREKDVEKGCVKKADIERECRTQQAVYYETVRTGHPICPGVIDLMFLNSNHMPFLQKLLEKSDEQAFASMQYLQDSVKNGAELAMISMEFARGEGEIVAGDKATDRILKRASPKIIAGMLKLAYMGYVNYDFHSANVMISVDNDTVVDATMIDFGRVAKLKTLLPEVKEFIFKRANFPLDQLLARMEGDEQFYTNGYNVMMALAAIGDMDLAYNIHFFGSHQIQCRDILVLAFDGKVSLGKDPPVLYPNQNEKDAFVPNPLIKEAILEYKKILVKTIEFSRLPWGIEKQIGGRRTHKRKARMRLVTKSSNKTGK